MSPRLMMSPAKGVGNLSLAPINTKSKATLEPLSLPSSVKVVGTGAIKPESKLSQIPNIESENETEFESAKTLMPKDNNQVDEIGALLGQEENSNAEMLTSINTR